MTGLKPEKLDAPAEDGSPSLDLLYRHHFTWLVRAVRHRFGRDQAEDLVQETYAHVAASQGVEIRNPKAFLLQVATRVAIDQQRRQSTRRDVSGSPAPGKEITDRAAQAEQLLLKQIVLSLPRSLRDTFLMSRIGGLTYDEIAEQQGVSVKTVEWRMTKALKHCARALRS